MTEFATSSSSDDPAIEFERLWIEAGFPNLTEFLSRNTPLHPNKLSEILRIDLRHRWFTESRLHAEVYFEKHSEVANDSEAAIDLIYAEYLLTEREQGTVDDELFVARFPSYVSTLRSQIELHRLTVSDSDRNSGGTSHLPMMETTLSREYSGVGQVHNARMIDERFQLIRELGRGAMGIVWEAMELKTGRRVAIKSFVHSWTDDKSDQERFLLEGKLAASVSHPNSAFLFESICKNEERFLVMELMPGRTLKDVAGLGPNLSVAKAVDYILDAIEGLDAAHRAGIIHRDIKPSNCFLDSNDRVKIGDFGLSHYSNVINRSLETGSKFSGTPAFAAPEQVRCEPATVFSDQYSLGATLFYLLAKRPPFVGNLQSVFSQVLNDEAPSVSQFVPGIPNELASIIAKCLRKNPDERYANLGLLHQALLPYSVTSTSLGNTGRRLTAYAIDELLIMAVSSVCFIAIIVLGLIGAGPITAGDETLNSRIRILILCASIAHILIEFSYFVMFEGLWGAGIGKRVMRLRVVGPDGGLPGLSRSGIRAFFIPMACGTSLIHSAVTSLWSTGNMLDTSAETNPIQGAFTSIAVGIGFNLPILFCLSSIRSANGFRGWHELFSKTKTVSLRKRDIAGRHTHPLMGKSSQDQVRSFGPFNAFKQRYETESYVVWDALDGELGRYVWIVEYRLDLNVHEAEVSTNRFSVDRPTRIRLLQDGIADQKYWRAYEAIPGSSLLDCRLTGQLENWDQVRALLFQLVTELQSSIEDSTLPDWLSLDHLWLNSSTQLVVLDLPMPGSIPQRTELLMQWRGDDRVRELVHSVFSLCCDLKVLPAQAHAFKRHLGKPIDPAPDSRSAWIHNAVQLLEKSQERPTTLRWDDRLGLLGLSIATEAWIYPFLILASGFFWVGNSNMELSVRLMCHFLLAIFLPTIQATLLGSNLIFHLSGIQVTGTNGEPASRLRKIVRDFAAWFPWTFTWALLGWVVAVVAEKVAIEQNGLSSEIEGNHFLVSRLVIQGFFCSSFLPFLVLVIGLVWTLWRPTRGLQDHVAGTSLFYK